MYLLAESRELIKIQTLRWTQVHPQSRHLAKKIRTWADCHPLTRYATRALTIRMRSGRVPCLEDQSNSRVSRLSLEAIIWIWAFLKPLVEVCRNPTRTTLLSRYKSVGSLMKLVKAKWAKVTKGQEPTMLDTIIKRCYLPNLPNNKSTNTIIMVAPPTCPKQ